MYIFGQQRSAIWVMSWFYNLHEEVERNAKYRISLQKRYLYLFNEQSSRNVWVGGGWFWTSFLAMLLVGISCHLAIKRSNFPLPAQSCNMCAADNHIFLAYILSMGTHLFKKWKTMTHHKNTLKNHEKQLETMKNHLEPCNMCATDNHICLAYIQWMINFIFILQNLFLILTGKEVQDCFQVSP